MPSVFRFPPLALIAALLAAAPAAAQPCLTEACTLRLPRDAGAIDVRDFGAKGDGVTDDTAALLAAATASGGDTGVEWWHDRIVFLPAGTYLVSDTLVKRYPNGRFASGLALIGEGPGRTVIRLADRAPGFADRTRPRAVIMTTSKLIDTGGSRDYLGKGEGNDAYENFVENLTVDVGAGNKGAVGIDFLANNLGAIRNVVVQAGEGSGAVGISARRSVPGPALIASTAVRGFRTGLSLAGSQYGITLFGVEFADQTETAVVNDGNVLSAEGLRIVRPGRTALHNAAAGGLVTLVGSTIDGPMINRGTVVFRRTAATLPGTAETASNRLNGQWTADEPFQSSPLTWSIERGTIDTVDPGPSERWAGVDGAPGREPADSTAAIQRALDSGASTVVLRHGTFWLSASLRIPPTVRRILGMNSTLRVFPARQPGFSHDDPMLSVTTAGGPLQIDHLAMDNSNLGGQLGIRLDASRPLLMRDIVSAGVVMLDRTPRGGQAVLEDVCCGPLLAAGSAPVTARQFNTEGGGVRIENRGAPLSILGLKTEQESTVASTSGGGRTEILGGLVYLVGLPSADPPPLFISRESSLAASFVEEVLAAGHSYQMYLRRQNDGQVVQVAPDTMPSRGFGRMIGLLSTGPR